MPQPSFTVDIGMGHDAMLVLMSHDVSKLSRLYVSADLTPGASVVLADEPAHYLKNVMRLSPGAAMRLFNGRDGEWLATLDALTKKNAELHAQSQIRQQPAQRRPVHLLFAPIKKARMDWLIEKAVELGVTDLHPVLTHHTEVRHINPDRITAQIIEAAEQCERLDLPRLHELCDLKTCLGRWPQDIAVAMALERAEAPPLHQYLPESSPLAFLVGPEGGFSAEEREYPVNLPFLRPVSLGSDILRSETAALFMLGAAHLYMQ